MKLTDRLSYVKSKAPHQKCETYYVHLDDNQIGLILGPNPRRPESMWTTRIAMVTPNGHDYETIHYDEELNDAKLSVLLYLDGLQDVDKQVAKLPGVR